MELTLTDEDARTLHDLLSDHLRDLQLEVARTEAKDFRHALLGRQDVVERLIVQLEQRLPPTATSPSARSSV